MPITILPQQKDFAKKRKKLTELQKTADAAARNAVKEWLSNNPDYSDLDVKVQNFSYVRNKKGVSKAIIAIAQRITWPSNVDKKQIDILKDIQPLFPDLELKPTIWQKKITGKLLQTVHIQINGNMTKPVNLKGCNTLSAIKKRVKAVLKAIGGKAYTFKPTVTFTPDVVIIGNKSYPIIKKVAKGLTYPSIKVPLGGRRDSSVRVDGLFMAIHEEYEPKIS